MFIWALGEVKQSRSAAETVQRVLQEYKGVAVKQLEEFNIDRLRMKRVLLLTVVLTVIASLVVFGIIRSAKPPVDIALLLNGDQLLCDGRPEGSGWIQVWRKKLDVLIETDNKAELVSKLATVKIRKRRLFLKLDPDLSYSILQDLLMESASRGFINYEIMAEVSDTPVCFSIFPDAQEYPDGKYEALDLRINSTGKDGLDERKFKNAIVQQQPIYLKIIPDAELSVGQVLRPIEICSSNSIAPLIAFIATRTHSEQFRGRQSATFEWKMRNVEIRNNKVIDEVVVPPDILEKAEN